MTDENNPVERRRLLHHLFDLLVIIRPAPDIPQSLNGRIKPVPIKGFQSAGGLLGPP